MSKNTINYPWETEIQNKNSIANYWSQMLTAIAYDWEKIIHPCR